MIEVDDDDEENPSEPQKIGLSDKMIYVHTEEETIRQLRTALDRLQNSSGTNSNATTIKHFKESLDLLEKRLNTLEYAYYDLMRRSCEMVKHKAIQIPPDQPPLQTVPWAVGQPAQTIHDKGELAKRTEDSTATIQKKK
jgi:hypothetical protein